jgi:hypothetical protein
MKKRTLWIVLTFLVVVAAALPLRGPVAGQASQSEAAAPQQMEAIPDMSTLLNYPYPVTIEDLLLEPERTEVLNKLMARPETVALMAEMAGKGFLFDPATADVMRIVIQDGTGYVGLVEAMTMSTIANELSGALTAMVAADGTGFFQAHHTNLDPSLAAVPDPPIIVNGMPYFYITSLRWINGQIIVWNYWWFDSHHHPNWYYSHYYWYWQYYGWRQWAWPYWYWWVHGWYYWRYWYYWSTWFPYLVDVPVTE